MVSVGIGLTNECNLTCAHCYRDQERIDRLSLEDVKQVCASLEISSIGLGTGENGLHPDYFEILKYLNSLGIRLTLASNGHTISITPDEWLTVFEDVEFSLDFPDRRRQDQFRGEGNWQTVMRSIERCSRLGIRLSILSVLMNLNYDDQGPLAQLAASLGSNLRINVYQPMFTAKFMLTFDQYWTAFQTLFEESEILSVTEPLVMAMLGLNASNGTPCGRQSIRITPDRRLKPCVYWPGSDLTIEHLAKEKERVFQAPLFQQTHQIPRACSNCTYLASCGGGCAARRILRGRLDEPDEYCPVVRGKSFPFKARLSSEARSPVRTGSICTTIVRGG